jgi:hypothetical protein
MEPVTLVTPWKTSGVTVPPTTGWPTPPGSIVRVEAGHLGHVGAVEADRRVLDGERQAGEARSAGAEIGRVGAGLGLLVLAHHVE